MKLKFVVLIKIITELVGEFRVSEEGIDTSNAVYGLNSFDEYALEAAVQLKEQIEPEVEVITVTIGHEEYTETIRRTLAMGADRSIRLWDPVLENLEFLDLPARSQILKTLFDEENPDLAFSGAMATDDMFASTGVHLAESIGWQWSTVIIDIQSFDSNQSTLTAQRELEGGFHEEIKIDLPALLTIQTGINRPRYPSLRKIRQAREKPFEVLDLEDLNIDQSSLKPSIQINNYAKPETDTEATLLEGSLSDQVDDLYKILVDQGVGNRG